VEIRARTDEKWMLQHHPSFAHERERAQQHPFHYFFSSLMKRNKPAKPPISFFILWHLFVHISNLFKH